MTARTPIPTFILKTYQMLEDPSIQHIVQWTAQGTAFIVYNQGQLAKQVLQNYFKHANYSSFVRQLNLYNFKKSRTNEGQIFKHKCFRKGMKSMLQFIKRRNQEEQMPLAIQEEPTLQVKEEQTLFKECALDIKETNTKLREDMKLLQDTSTFLIDQMQSLNQFVYNQSVDIELKFKQVGQMLHVINDELRQEDKTDTQSIKYPSDIQFYQHKTDELYQESKIGSPNPYGDYNSIPFNPADYDCFINSFE